MTINWWQKSIQQCQIGQKPDFQVDLKKIGCSINSNLWNKNPGSETMLEASWIFLIFEWSALSEDNYVPYTSFSILNEFKIMNENYTPRLRSSKESIGANFKTLWLSLYREQRRYPDEFLFWICLFLILTQQLTFISKLSKPNS